MHNHDDKYPARPGFEPGTSRLQAPVDTNEPSWPAVYCWGRWTNNMSRVCRDINRVFGNVYTLFQR